MTSFLRISILSALFVMLGTPVFAQQSDTQTFPLTPVSPWHYGVTQQGEADVFGGCVFSTIYDNGFILRFTENDGEVQRVSFDFRQEVFKPRNVYPSKIEVADKVVLVPGVATSFTKLEYKTAGQISTQELYMNKDKPLQVTIEGKKFIFRLAGLKEAMESLKDCKPLPISDRQMSPLAAEEKTAPVTPQVAQQDFIPHQAPVHHQVIPANQQQATNTTGQPTGLLPVPGLGDQNALRYDPSKQSPQDVVAQIEGKTQSSLKASTGTADDPWGIKAIAAKGNQSQKDATSDQLAKAEPKTLNVDGARFVEPAKILYRKREVVGLPEGYEVVEGVGVKKQSTAKFHAEAGESLQNVLARWSRDAGVNLVWDSNDEFVLPIDINSNSSFQETIAQTLALFDDQKMRPFGAMDFKPGTAGTTKGLNDTGTKKVSDNGLLEDTKEWLALEGMDLRAVVEGWAAAEGIKVVWLTSHRYNLKDTVRVRDGFSQAVKEALEQFVGQEHRPVAQLNTDPNDGRQVLLVKASEQQVTSNEQG